MILCLWLFHFGTINHRYIQFILILQFVLTKCCKFHHHPIWCIHVILAGQNNAIRFDCRIVKIIMSKNAKQIQFNEWKKNGKKNHAIDEKPNKPNDSANYRWQLCCVAWLSSVKLLWRSTAVTVKRLINKHGNRNGHKCNKPIKI